MMRSYGEIYTTRAFTRTRFGFKNIERRYKPQDLLYGKLETPPICRQPFHRWYFFSFRNLDDCKKVYFINCAKSYYNNNRYFYYKLMC